MSNKLIAVLCVGLLLLIACSPQATPTAAPESQEATEESTEVAAAPTEAQTEAAEEASEGDGAAGGVQTAWTCPDGFDGQTLSVFNWTTYVAEDTVSNFEELCGVSVTYTTFASNDELLARIRAGNPGYDIIVPSDYMVAIMRAEELVEPLDKEKIPNFANVGEIFRDPAYDSGNEYSVPYQWGTIGIGYDKTKVGQEVTSWQQMFDYDGPVSWYDDARTMLAIGLLMLGHDPNSTSAEEIEAARDFLIENGENVIYFHQDDGQAYLQRGEVDMVVEFSGDIFQLGVDCECEDYAYVIPSEGANLWRDNVSIPVDAPNPDLAHAFIDYILDPQVGADISNYTAYGTPNQAALDERLVDEALLDFYPIEFPPELRDKLYFAADIPEAETLYADAWDEVKVALGQ